MCQTNVLQVQGACWRHRQPCSCRCELQGFDGAGFDECLAGRRLIMIGDSTMNGIFSSLGCMLKDRLTSGRHRPWDTSNMTKIHDKFEYISRGGEAVRQVIPYRLCRPVHWAYSVAAVPWTLHIKT